MNHFHHHESWASMSIKEHRPSSEQDVSEVPDAWAVPGCWLRRGNKNVLNGWWMDSLVDAVLQQFCRDTTFCGLMVLMPWDLALWRLLGLSKVVLPTIQAGIGVQKGESWLFPRLFHGMQNFRLGIENGWKEFGILRPRNSVKLRQRKHYLGVPGRNVTEDGIVLSWAQT